MAGPLAQSPPAERAKEGRKQGPVGGAQANPACLTEESWMVAPAVPATSPLAPQPGPKRLVEAGALLATIHVAGLIAPRL